MACSAGTKISRRLEAICVVYESSRSVGGSYGIHVNVMKVIQSTSNQVLLLKLEKTSCEYSMILRDKRYCISLFMSVHVSRLHT